MPAPRVFVSSTCYDLQDSRFALRQFITDFGFEPVMSEFGDIFYVYDQHIQDACIAAIEKCNIFLLIVGNQYGSIYHQQTEVSEAPSSVTLEEFKKALSVDIPKHIFVNRFLYHDYKNFRSYFDDQLKQHFDAKEVSDEEIPKNIRFVRQTVDKGYPFPQTPYRYIFHFLDLIADQKVNNAILTFETFGEITDQLRRQWAGFMYDALTTSRSVSTRVVQEFTSRLDSRENILRQMVASKGPDKSGQISLNIEAISKSLAPNELKQAQDMLQQALECIMSGKLEMERGFLTQTVDVDSVLKWLESLGYLLKNYKWANSIAFTEVLSGFKIPIKYYPNRDQEIPTEQIMRLYGLYRNLPEQEQESFARTVLLKLRPIIRPKSNQDFPDEDDLPF
jgi:hypothetical protein